MSFFFTDLTSSKTTLLSSLCVPRTHWQYPRPFLASRTRSPSLAPIHILPSCHTCDSSTLHIRIGPDAHTHDSSTPRIHCKRLNSELGAQTALHLSVSK